MVLNPFSKKNNCLNISLRTLQISVFYHPNAVPEAIVYQLRILTNQAYSGAATLVLPEALGYQLRIRTNQAYSGAATLVLPEAIVYQLRIRTNQAYSGAA